MGSRLSHIRRTDTQIQPGTQVSLAQKPLQLEARKWLCFLCRCDQILLAQNEKFLRKGPRAADEVYEPRGRRALGTLLREKSAPMLRRNLLLLGAEEKPSDHEVDRQENCDDSRET